jgi:hypothetical protein
VNELPEKPFHLRYDEKWYGDGTDQDYDCHSNTAEGNDIQVGNLSQNGRNQPQEIPEHVYESRAASAAPWSNKPSPDPAGSLQAMQPPFRLDKKTAWSTMRLLKQRPNPGIRTIVVGNHGEAKGDGHEEIGEISEMKSGIPVCAQKGDFDAKPQDQDNREVSEHVLANARKHARVPREELIDRLKYGCKEIIGQYRLAKECETPDRCVVPLIPCIPASISNPECDVSTSCWALESVICSSKEIRAAD